MNKSWWDISCKMGWDETPPKRRPIKRLRWLNRQHRIYKLEIALKIYVPLGRNWWDDGFHGTSYTEDKTMTAQEYKDLFV